jgi:hypothetical protein
MAKQTAPRCECGCGGTTRGGRFLPGHDAKLKSQLLAKSRTGRTTRSRQSAQGELRKRGWA